MSRCKRQWGTATHVGNLIGAGKPFVAKVAAYVNFFFTLTISSSLAVLLYMFRWEWGGLFTADVAVQRLVAASIPIIAIYIPSDAL